MRLKDAIHGNISCFHCCNIPRQARWWVSRTCMNYSKGRWKKLGNKGIKRAEEIIGEVGTTCNLEFWRWTFKVAITGSGHLAELYSFNSHVILFVLTRTHGEMQMHVELCTCMHPHVGTHTNTTIKSHLLINFPHSMKRSSCLLAFPSQLIVIHLTLEGLD